MSRVLVVESGSAADRDLAAFLKALGYSVSRAISGEHALTAAVQVKPDIVLMATQLDGPLDGIQAAALIQAETGIPLIFVTACADSETMERAALLEPAGYIIKPFHERDLATILQFTLLKSRNRLSANPREPPRPVRLGGLEIDFIRHRVIQRGVELQLTKKEFLILQCLVERPGVPVSAETILTRMWGPQFVHYVQTLRVHIGHVRRKIEGQRTSGIHIETVRGIGYRITERQVA